MTRAQTGVLHNTVSMALSACSRQLKGSRHGLAEEELYRKTNNEELNHAPKGSFHRFLRTTSAAVHAQPWRSRLGHTLESHAAHLLILFLVVLDLVAVACEVMLASVCGITRNEPINAQSASEGEHRLLEAVPHTISEAAITAEEARMERVETWEQGLHGVSIAILAILIAYQALLLLSFGSRFFHKFWYVSDTIIIVVSLVLELTLRSDEGGFLTILLTWRVVRIIHGFVVAEEEEESDVSGLRKQLSAAQDACTCGGVHRVILANLTEESTRSLRTQTGLGGRPELCTRSVVQEGEAYSSTTTQGIVELPVVPEVVPLSNGGSFSSPLSIAVIPGKEHETGAKGGVATSRQGGDE